MEPTEERQHPEVASERSPLDLSCPEQLQLNWAALTRAERSAAFSELPRVDAEDLFLQLEGQDQAELLQEISAAERRAWVRLLAPDDMADLIQALPEEDREAALALLDPQTRAEVNVLLAYAEDEAGGLMNSRFVRLRADMTTDEAIRYLRIQTTGQAETVYYAYVLDADQRLLGIASFRRLFSARGSELVANVMTTDVRVVYDDQDQEEVGRLFSQTSLQALPVVDRQGRMKGIVTVDDIVKVVEEEATEDIQKIGGMEALDSPYLKAGLFEIVRKRAGWLLVLFIGQMFTATAMAYYEAEIQRAVVLALFIPLVISSGGNSGSQATTLVIRAMALGEVRLRDWWRVLGREVASGAILGAILGVVGWLRILYWPEHEVLYGIHYARLALVVGLSLIGIVLWGTLAGSMLPFLLRRVGFDPASASAPFVATIVDVTGLVIYFTVATSLLTGSLL